LRGGGGEPPRCPHQAAARAGDISRGPHSGSSPRADGPMAGVSWLPDQGSPRPSGPSAGRGRGEDRSPVTVAGPRRIRTGFLRIHRWRSRTYRRCQVNGAAPRGGRRLWVGAVLGVGGAVGVRMLARSALGVAASKCWCSSTLWWWQRRLRRLASGGRARVWRSTPDHLPAHKD
jgi:hypothetical protein